MRHFDLSQTQVHASISDISDSYLALELEKRKRKQQSEKYVAGVSLVCILTLFLLLACSKLEKSSVTFSPLSTSPVYTLR